MMTVCRAQEIQSELNGHEQGRPGVGSDAPRRDRALSPIARKAATVFLRLTTFWFS